MRPCSPILRRSAVLAQRTCPGAITLEVVLAVAQRVEDARDIARKAIALRCVLAFVALAALVAILFARLRLGLVGVVLRLLILRWLVLRWLILLLPVSRLLLLIAVLSILLLILLLRVLLRIALLAILRRLIRIVLRLLILLLLLLFLLGAALLVFLALLLFFFTQAA